MRQHFKVSKNVFKAKFIDCLQSNIAFKSNLAGDLGSTFFSQLIYNPISRPLWPRHDSFLSPFHLYELKVIVNRKKKKRYCIFPPNNQWVARIHLQKSIRIIKFQSMDTFSQGLFLSNTYNQLYHHGVSYPGGKCHLHSNILAFKVLPLS